MLYMIGLPVALLFAASANPRSNFMSWLFIASIWPIWLTLLIGFTIYLMVQK